MAKPVLPWSLKGVSPEAREIAKKAAAQHGMTIGEWVSAAIRDVGPGAADAPPAAVPAESSAAPAVPAGIDEDELRAAVRERIYQAEEQVAHIVGPLQDIIEHMARRLTRLEESVEERNTELPGTSEPRRLDNW